MSVKFVDLEQWLSVKPGTLRYWRTHLPGDWQLCRRGGLRIGEALAMMVVHRLVIKGAIRIGRLKGCSEQLLAICTMTDTCPIEKGVLFVGMDGQSVKLFPQDSWCGRPSNFTHHQIDIARLFDQLKRHILFDERGPQAELNLAATA